jgi:hypothetical protein
LLSSCFIGNRCTRNYLLVPQVKKKNVKLVRQWEGHYGAKNLIASLTFQNRTIFNENLMAIELSKKELIFNKPMYIGMAIFDIAKICVYDFHYSYIIMSPT